MNNPIDYKYTGFKWTKEDENGTLNIEIGKQS